MGLLRELSETGSRINPALLMTENKDRAAAFFRESSIKQGARLFDEGGFYDLQAKRTRKYSEWNGLNDLFESDNPRDQWKAAMTMLAVEKTRQYIENAKEAWGEATVQTSLGALNPRVLDVVRIFYPNQIATELVDIQPIDGQVGEIFIMKPIFSNSLPASDIGPVIAGQEIFKTATYDYASEVVNEKSVGTVTAATAYTWTVGRTPVIPRTVSIVAVVGGNTVVVGDDGNGNLVGASLNPAGPNTVNYTTGAMAVNYSAAPTAASSIYSQYAWSSEANTAQINEVEFNLTTVPVQARIHPLKFTYSVAAGLAASAHLAIDVQDTLAELSGQYLKVERDNKLVWLINNSASTQASLAFDASQATQYFDRQSKYADIELKINEAESLIQTAMGRGGISWIMGGQNATNLMAATKGFVRAPVTAPIGSYVVGHMRDGTIPVIRATKVMATNDYIVGYKGYMAGDAAVVLAEWIPIYFTPVFQAPTLQNQQGLMSMYDLFVNNAGYMVKGTVTGYSA
jgi:Major capsid protein Gp23